MNLIVILNCNINELLIVGFSIYFFLPFVLAIMNHILCAKFDYKFLLSLLNIYWYNRAYT